MRTRKSVSVLLVPLIMTACSSNAKKMPEEPATETTVAKSPSGDSPSQITIQGELGADADCPVAKQNLMVELREPIPSIKVIGTARFNDSGTYQIMTTAHRGNFSVSLVNSLNNQTLVARQIQVDDQDHFYIDFSSCRR